MYISNPMEITQICLGFHSYGKALQTFCNDMTLNKLCLSCLKASNFDFTIIIIQEVKLLFVYRTTYLIFFMSWIWSICPIVHLIFYERSKLYMITFCTFIHYCCNWNNCFPYFSCNSQYAQWTVSKYSFFLDQIRKTKILSNSISPNSIPLIYIRE